MSQRPEFDTEELAALAVGTDPGTADVAQTLARQCQRLSEENAKLRRRQDLVSGYSWIPDVELCRIMLIMPHADAPEYWQCERCDRDDCQYLQADGTWGYPPYGWPDLDALWAELDRQGLLPAPEEE